MRVQVQNAIQKIAEKYDARIRTFEVEIKQVRGKKLTLQGRVLEGSQVKELQHRLNRLFPNLCVDSSAVRVLQSDTNPSVWVATNLTGFYEGSTFHTDLVNELRYGSELEVLEERGEWVYARQPDGYLGWAYRDYLTERPVPQPTHIVLAPSVEVRAGPDSRAETLTRVMSGTCVAVESVSGDWAKVVANVSGWIPSSDLRALDDLPQTQTSRRNQLEKDAIRMIGVPYLWGGCTGNGIDCSGLARLLHAWIGISIPRDADMQCQAAQPVEPPFEIGDLLFFGGKGGKRKITHVGVSLGGWRIVHSSGRRNGVYVDDVQQQEGLSSIYISAGTFIGR